MSSSIVLFCFLIVTSCVKCYVVQDFLTETILAQGYQNEVHTVTTADKYILNLHRIPGNRTSSRPIVIVHGMTASSLQFTITGPGIPKENSIVFKLADHGHDVWLINVRGTEFSSNHETLPSTSPQYWKFSFDEIAKYDLPAAIDYVLKHTNKTSAHYIGHSQGTTVALALLSSLPKYNKKLKTVHLMAPSVLFGHPTPLVRMIAMLSPPIENAAASMGMDSVYLAYRELANVGGYSCSTNSQATLEICKQIVFSILGPSKHLNPAFFKYPALKNLFQHIPTTVSFMQLLHYAQLVNQGKGKFMHFDHKREGNLRMYNQTTPPEYQLSNVKTKIHILYGTTDQLATYPDSELLIKELDHATIAVDKIVGYNHIDFVAAKDVDKLVNTKILDIINRYPI